MKILERITPYEFLESLNRRETSLQAEIIEKYRQDILTYLQVQANWDELLIDKKYKTAHPPQNISAMKACEGLAQGLIRKIKAKNEAYTQDQRNTHFDSLNYSADATNSANAFKCLIGKIDRQNSINKIHLNALLWTLFEVSWYDYEFCYSVCSHFRMDFSIEQVRAMLSTYNHDQHTERPQNIQQIGVLLGLPAPDTQNEQDADVIEVQATEVNTTTQDAWELVQDAYRIYMLALDNAFEHQIRQGWVQAYKNEILEEENKKLKRNRRVTIWTAVALLLSGGVYGLWTVFNQPRKLHFSQAQKDKVIFKLANKTVSQNRPMETHFYEYDFSSLGVDTLWWTGGIMGEDEVNYITPAKGDFRKIFTKPMSGALDFYYKNTKGERKFVYELPVHITSQTWYGWADAGNDVERVRPPQSIFYNGAMHIPIETLKERMQKKSRNSQEDLSASFWYVEDFGISADDCILEYQFSNTPEEGGKSCFGLSASFGESYLKRTHIPIQEPECAYYNALHVGNTVRFGHQTIFYGFQKAVQEGLTNYVRATDFAMSPAKGLQSFTQFPIYCDGTHTVKIVVKNQQVSVYIDHRATPSFQSPYTGKIGKFKFLSFGFKGLGSIYFVRLRDGAGKEVYFEDFDNPSKPAKPRP